MPESVAEERNLEAELRRHVRQLAETVGERHIGRPGSLDAAAEYIASTLGRCTTQEFQSAGHTVRNIEAGAVNDRDVIVIGAHYDTVPGSPGANDNGSGVAALLALAGRLTGLEQVRFVFFVNEEPPYFQTPEMGSYVYARRCSERDENVSAMLSLETIGCYSDAPGSQSYPFPALGYPDRGNFIGFVSNLRSRFLLKKVVNHFQGFPCESLAAPEWIPGVAWSDHWSFWQFGYPAAMVTDTAPWRYSHYHLATDTPDKLNYERMAQVVEALQRVIPVLRPPAHGSGQPSVIPHL